MQAKQGAILWLCSWYPHREDPFHGDFIQRHARALSIFRAVHVLHIPLRGPDQPSHAYESQVEQEGILEWIRGLEFKPAKPGLLNRIRYNRDYQRAWAELLKAYTDQYGKPVLVHVQVAMKAGIAARHFCKLHQIPYLVSEQASLYDTQGVDNWNTRSWYFRWQTTRIMRGAKGISNVSDRLARRIEALFQVPTVRTIRNTVDTQLFYPEQPSTQFRWFHASALGEQKRPEDMIKAFGLWSRQRKPDWELVICGPIKPALVALAEAEGIGDRIQWRGMVSYATVAAEMRAASALVLFSWHENFPCVVVEALCSGLPVLASAVGGISEAIDDTNGRLVEVHADVQTMANCLDRFRDLIPTFNRSEIADKAHSRYRYEVIGQQFYQWYRDLGVLP